MIALSQAKKDECSVKGNIMEEDSNCSHTAEIEAEVQRLRGLAWEVASLLRPSLTCAADLLAVDRQQMEALSFIDEALPRAARILGSQACGPVFQALLALSSGSNPGHSLRPGSARHISVSLENFAAKDIDCLVSGADQLCRLLRLKIEDDGDLGMARKALQEGHNFFSDLWRCSEQRGIGAWEQFQQCHG